MKVSYLPVLGVLRELYAQPRSMARFREYIATLTGGGDDVVLPIGVANPMAKEHALAKLDELLALGAEDAGTAATEEAHHRLAWTSESVMPEALHGEVLAAIYRVAYQQRFGLPPRAGFQVALAHMQEQDPVAALRAR